ncbi:MAG: TraR/DksA family transcriptional regulator [Bradymonadaceae bacterium]
MDDETMRELREELVEKRDEIHDRWRRIESDRRHENEPLDKDLEDQSVELENEEVLNQLDPTYREELKDVLAALDRMEEGTYGTCVACGDQIAVDRLKAIPYARRCIECAEAAELS